MKIQILIENTAKQAFYSEHGLSIHVQTEGQKILFDTGKSDQFLENAKKLDVDISQVDFAVLSHGHYDHGGGLSGFLNHNTKTPVYLQETALLPHYARRADGRIEDIGIASELREHPQLEKINGDYVIEKGLRLFQSVTGRRFMSESNQVLLMRSKAGYRKDSFVHEQNLLIEREGKKVLLSGCAHRGLVNILERAMELAGGPMDVVIGGFHLSNPAEGGTEAAAVVKGVADYLAFFQTKYYTCHCTGLPAYQLLRERLGEQIEYLSAGSVLEI